MLHRLHRLRKYYFSGFSHGLYFNELATSTINIAKTTQIKVGKPARHSKMKILYVLCTTVLFDCFHSRLIKKFHRTAPGSGINFLKDVMFCNEILFQSSIFSKMSGLNCNNRPL